MKKPDLAIADLQPVLQARHTASGYDHALGGWSPLFSDYVAQSRAMLASAHQRLGHSDWQCRAVGNAPFELFPAREDGRKKRYARGILLTHGLTDSPYFMRALGEFFCRQGFYVMAPLLPGHGTQPGDLLAVRYQRWIDMLSYATRQLAGMADRVCLGGFSAGGLLSVRQSLQEEDIKALFLFAPALKISAMARLASLHKLYSFCCPDAEWINICPDSSYFKYESTPKNLATQAYQLIRQVQQQLTRGYPRMPIFCALSEDDATTQSQAALNFMAQAPNTANRLMVFMRDPEREVQGFSAEQLLRVGSVFTEKKILSSAHTAIMLPPDDPVYGEQGSYVNAIHYYPQQLAAYRACWQHQPGVYLGETTRENLAKGYLQRLMYNPNHALMLQAMEQFIVENQL